MHKSRLQTLVIDCETDDLASDAAFWGSALGCKVLACNMEPGDENYRELEVDPSQPKILVQKVIYPSRVHLDIEADDIEAEVVRLERLGAQKVGKVRHFTILEHRVANVSAWCLYSVLTLRKKQMFGWKEMVMIHNKAKYSDVDFPH